jgi:ribosomal protein L37AE/L43A
MKIDWEEYAREEEAERLRAEGYRHAAEGYEHKACLNCGRHRVALRRNGLCVCDKCGWDQQKNDYDFWTIDRL